MVIINKTIGNRTAVFSLEGRLDTITAPELEQEIRALPDDMSGLTLDMEKLDYISSAGLRVLLIALKKMEHQGGVQVVNVNENIRGILDITGFSDILTIGSSAGDTPADDGTDC